jgi:hypothetical protein
MSGLCTLEELIAERGWDDICAKVNGDNLTLYGWHNSDLELRPIPTPLQASPHPHPQGAPYTALFVSMDVFENEEGELRCEPQYYWGVVAKQSDVAKAWGRKRKAGAPNKKIQATMQVLADRYPNGVPEGVTDSELVKMVNEELSQQGGTVKEVSKPTVSRARKKVPGK